MTEEGLVKLLEAAIVPALNATEERLGKRIDTLSERLGAVEERLGAVEERLDSFSERIDTKVLHADEMYAKKTLVVPVRD